jgi:Protein of unknown function (DUF1615)
LNRTRTVLVSLIAGVLAGCGASTPREPPIDPDVARAHIAKLLPPGVNNRSAWAADIFAALEALELRPTTEHACAAIGVTQQESTFQVDPPVAGLATIARKEIDERAARYHIPKLVVSAALNLTSPNGKSYSERLKQAKTERELSEIFEDFIDIVPLGKRLFADLNPVRTGGPMQVAIAYAEAHAAEHRYPYPMPTNVRREVFTRRGGLYFGIAHLLDYEAPYEDMLYRFADFNAGHYASRNAAFQQVVGQLTKTQLALDGDLLLYGERANEPSKTELAVRGLASRLEMDERQIRRDLEREKQYEFQESKLYEQVYELADRAGKGRAARATLPRIKLKSPKITRNLTTEWFAKRVNERYKQCVARGSRASG